MCKPPAVFVCRGNRAPAVYYQLGTLNDLILERLIELDKVAAPAPNANDQISVGVRALLRGKKVVAVHGVELELMSAAKDEQPDERGDFFNAVRRAKDGIVQFERERPSVCNADKMLLCKGLYDRHRAFDAGKQTRGIVCGERIARIAPVRRRGDRAAEP